MWLFFNAAVYTFTCSKVKVCESRSYYMCNVTDCSRAKSSLQVTCSVNQWTMHDGYFLLTKLCNSILVPYILKKHYIYQLYKYQRDATFFFLFGFYNSICFGRGFASIVRSNTNCSSSHWCVSWVRSRINPMWESLTVCIIFHGSMGLMARWCTL